MMRDMKPRKRLYTAVLSISAMVGAFTAPAAAAAAGDSGPWEIHSNFSRFKCLEIAGARPSDGGTIQMYECATTVAGAITPLHQRWTFRDLGNGYYHLISGSNKCLNVAGNSGLTGAKIISYTCQLNTVYNDQWQVTRRVDGSIDYYEFRNRNSGKCVQVGGEDFVNDGDDATQWPCDNGANQLFTWDPATQANFSVA